MNEQQFLDLLDSHLQILKQQERADIRRDFEEYFDNGRAEGKTTEEIIESFGNIEELAQELLASYDEEDLSDAVSIVENDELVPYSRVKIDVEGVNVSIVPTDMKHAIIETKDKDNLTDATMVIKNDTLIVKAVRQEQIRRFWFITIIGNLGKADVIVHLPKKQYEQIVIDNTNGAIKVTDALAKRFYMKSDNGRILTENIHGEMLDAYSDNSRVVLINTAILNVKAGSSNGKVIAENVEANHLQLESDNGHVEVKDVAGEINARSRNGRIIAQLKTVKHPLNFVTDNGSISLKTVGKLENVDMACTTRWGTVTIYNEQTTSYVHGSKDYPIKLKTSNGKITVEEVVLQQQ